MYKKITTLLTATTLSLIPFAADAQVTVQAVNDNATVAAGNSVTINVMNNDIDLLGQAYMSRYTEPTVGMLVKNANNTFTYTAPAGYTGTVEFSYTLRTCDLTVVPVGHMYQYVAAPGISWNEAKDSAENMTFNGMQGYLATIMSPAENLLVQAVSVGGAQGWIGGSDQEQEGIWKWVTGPEAGEQFSAQDTTFANGPVTPQLPCKYHNWAILEPNEEAGDEDFLQFRGYNGSWNDMRDILNVPDMDGFYVEFGGMESNSVPNTSTAIVTITVTNGCVQANPTITVTPSNSTYTGGVPTNLYIGYGPQSATLSAKVGNTTTGYAFSWSPSANLSNPAISNPVFTPTAPGIYNFTVTATKNGCTSTATVTFCVKDIRVKGNGNSNSKKVYICHVPPGNPSNANTLSISVNAVPAHIGLHGGDYLGSCNAVCGANARMAGSEDIREVIDGDLSLEVFPNPNSGSFIAKLPLRDSEVKLKVYDIFGKVIAEKEVHTLDENEVKFDLISRPAGIYLVEANDGIQRATTRVIVK